MQFSRSQLIMHLLSRTDCKCEVIVTFNKQQLSELFNRDHFESLLNEIFLPQKSENVRPHPILVTLLKMQPHSSQSSRENATPSSGTYPLASYNNIPPRGKYHGHLNDFRRRGETGDGRLTPKVFRGWGF